MQLRIVVQVCSYSLLALTCVGRSSGDSSSVFLLKDDTNHQWCAYASKAAWQSRVDDITARTVAGAEYDDGQLVKLDVSENDESGDWLVSDHYTVDREKRLVQLQRSIEVIPDRAIKEERYSIKNGRLTKDSSVVRSMSNNEIVAAPDLSTPSLRVATRVSDFGFASLIGDRKHLEEVLNAGSKCIQAK